jgi:hypothetical protein
MLATVARKRTVACVTAKTIVFDIATNWTDGADLGVRRIEFKFESGLLTPTYTAYGTTRFSSSYDYAQAFNTTLSKTGNGLNNAWMSDHTATNERLIVVFDTLQTFDEIVLNNYHDSGAETDKGAKQVKITRTLSTYTNTVYGATVTGGVVMNNTQWPQHAGADSADDQTVWSF